MKITELNGKEVKRLCGCIRAIKRYHNRHKDGSGNFGFTLVYPAPAGSQAQDAEAWYSLDGDYGSVGEICFLELRTFSGSASCQINPKSIAVLAALIKAFHESIQEQGGLQICQSR